MNTRNTVLVSLLVGVFGLGPSALAQVPAARKADYVPAKDEQIDGWVQRALRDDPRTRDSEISVNTTDGIVRLTGTAKTLAARSYAELEAKKITGVRGVIDEIEVQSAVRTDDQIVRDVEARLAASPLLQASPDIQVTAKDGAVTLLGKVMGHSEAQEAELLASSVQGVTGVKNDLRIGLRFRRYDRDVRGDVLDALDRDAYLTYMPIEVEVKDGRVTLAGSVGNAYQKDRATNRALMVDGVAGVDNQLEIDPALDQGTRSDESLSDDDIEATIRTELSRDRRVDADAVSVSVKQGDATLAGAVGSAYQRIVAERDVQDVVGVSKVENELVVNPADRSDEQIREDVTTFLSTDATLAGSDLNVKVKSGVVTLSGSVADGWEKAHAEEMASRPRGVVRVVNKLKVKDGERTPATTLEERIENRLGWDWTTSLVAPRIDVDVMNGVATLSGDVDSWAQRIEAARVALSVEGVRMVDDQLTVLGFLGAAPSFYFPEDFLFDPWYLWRGLPG